ncbi:hypothetical protein Vretifemale_16566 [Volvox reticuliferus]|uniref:Uncharacterized protein n=1 Tax=Volvox reticuliferus TaxID=1737510 RepID=A0A8J4FW99_9CHLO|nr:hypothetical protein Vretifemale_16566 [Volvox reticuliferus]
MMVLMAKASYAREHERFLSSEPGSSRILSFKEVHFMICFAQPKPLCSNVVVWLITCRVPLQGGNGSEGSSVGKAPTFVTGAGACEDWLKFPYSDAPHEKRFTASTTKGVPLASVMPPLDEIDTDRLGCQPFSSLDASPGALLGASFTSCGGSKVAETGDAVLPVAPRHPWSLSSPAPPLMVKMPSSQNIINTADAAVVNGALRPTPINAHGVTNWVDPMINGHCDTDATCMTLGTSSKRRRIDTALLPVQQLATCSAAGSCKMASPGVAIVDVSTPSASCFQDVTMPASSSGEQVVKRMSLSDSNVAEMVELPSSDWPSFNSDVDIDMTDDELRSWLSDL